jgi:ABC-type multidrug transport system ATPase subunit
MDEHSQQALRLLAKEAASSGTAVVIASNHLAWLEGVAERYLALNEGAVVAEGTATQLKNTSGAGHKDLASIYSAVFDG